MYRERPTYILNHACYHNYMYNEWPDHLDIKSHDVKHANFKIDVLDYCNDNYIWKVMLIQYTFGQVST